MSRSPNVRECTSISLFPFAYVRYGADPRNPPTREALARMEGRSLEGVSQEDVARDAEAIEQLMEITLRQEKDETKKAQVGRHFSGRSNTSRGSPLRRTKG